MIILCQFRVFESFTIAVTHVLQTLLRVCIIPRENPIPLRGLRWNHAKRIKINASLQLSQLLEINSELPYKIEKQQLMLG